MERIIEVVCDFDVILPHSRLKRYPTGVFFGCRARRCGRTIGRMVVIEAEKKSSAAHPSYIPGVWGGALPQPDIILEGENGLRRGTDSSGGSSLVGKKFGAGAQSGSGGG